MEEIYQKYSEKIRKYLLYLCEDQELAEDLTQETIIRAMFGIKNFRNDCTIKVWLCQIAKNLWRKELKKKEKLITMPMGVEIGKIGADTNIESELIEREDRKELYEQIEQLNSPFKEIIYLKLNLEFTFIEIGQLFGMSEVWARGKFYMGKRKIMENLRKGGKIEIK